MKKLLVLLLALVCAGWMTAALAEDVYFVQDAADVSRVTTDCGYLRVGCQLHGDQHVTMTIRDDWDSLYYQRDYGTQSGYFCSEDVYLRLDGDQSDYRVTVQTGDDAHSFRVTRQLPLVTDNNVYGHGLTLEEISSGSSRKFAVILDVDALEGEALTVPMLSDGVQLGYLTYEVMDGELTITAELSAYGTIDKATVYVARDAVTARTLGSKHYAGKKLRLDNPIDLSSTPYAAVLVQLTVSYDPTTAFAWREDNEFLLQQQELWQLMQLMTANEALG